MGDRISIQFENMRLPFERRSVVLFSQSDGMGLIKKVEEYMSILGWSEERRVTPLDRREPDTVMVDFIRFLTKDKDVVDSNYYLGRTRKDGDNSDNGHVVISFKKSGYEINYMG